MIDAAKYRERARSYLQSQQSEPETEELHVVMLAMFLCDSGIITLGPSGEGARLSTGHGWHRTRADEREMYFDQARRALSALTRRRIP